MSGRRAGLASRVPRREAPRHAERREDLALDEGAEGYAARRLHDEAEDLVVGARVAVTLPHRRLEPGADHPPYTLLERRYGTARRIGGARDAARVVQEVCERQGHTAIVGRCDAEPRQVR